ncbi:hypothetical protein [Pediococcus pentosaceus]|uniref:hypothetical protein n=1 Tax=Pediococcus pentosaceus TaxID=1255 RepID=UPI002380B5A8|nr:hypothetical protein [Pediococcus pentosaceus]MDE3751889.1 hypothetical protein [Pediococcus pentosaceus]
MDLTTMNVIIAGGTSLLGSLIGAGLAFWGARRGAKIQSEVSEKNIKNSMEIAKMNIEEKLIAENKISWDNETRKLISKFIRQCFDINHGIENVKIIEQKKKLSVDPTISAKERKQYSELSKEDVENVKQTMSILADAMETMTEIRLHIFDKSDVLGNQLLDAFVNAEQHFEKNETIPSAELAQLTELSRNYFERQWKELTKDIN